MAPGVLGDCRACDHGKVTCPKCSGSGKTICIRCLEFGYMDNQSSTGSSSLEGFMGPHVASAEDRLFAWIFSWAGLRWLAFVALSLIILAPILAAIAQATRGNEHFLRPLADLLIASAKSAADAVGVREWHALAGLRSVGLYTMIGVFLLLSLVGLRRTFIQVFLAMVVALWLALVVSPMALAHAPSASIDLGSRF